MPDAVPKYFSSRVPDTNRQYIRTTTYTKEWARRKKEKAGVVCGNRAGDAVFRLALERNRDIPREKKGKVESTSSGKNNSIQNCGNYQFVFLLSI